MKKLLQKYLNKGTQFVDNHEDRRRVREINGLTYSGILFIIPAIIARNILIEDWKEVQLFTGYTVVMIAALLFNHFGKNQIAAKLILTLSSLLTVVAVYINDVQIGAPFLNVVIGISSLHMIKKPWQAYSVLVMAFLFFSISMCYQSMYLPFDIEEFKLTVVVIGVLFAMMIVSRKEVTQMQNEITRQSETIQQQNEEMLALKQKDIESLSGNFSVLNSFKSKVEEELSLALKSADVSKSVQQVILGLRSEEELHQKVQLLSQNFDQINAEFYAKLIQQHPTISSNEKELSAYLKLGLSNKEIASIKNTTENAITVAKSRLRKKMGKENNAELVNYFSQL